MISFIISKILGHILRIHFSKKLLLGKTAVGNKKPRSPQ